MIASSSRREGPAQAGQYRGFTFPVNDLPWDDEFSVELQEGFPRRLLEAHRME
jgi:hypothetical protein